MKSNFSQFIGNGSLQKTLRNGLIPIGKTQENIEKAGILTEDEERKEKRGTIKNILNDYYRYFINHSLGNCEIEWNDLFDGMEKFKKGKISEDELKKEQGKKRKEVASYYTKDHDIYGMLFKKDVIEKVLPDFIKANEEYSDDEKREYLETVDLFKGFTTTFTDFFSNRKNVFTSDEKSTSTCHRIVNVNADIFGENISTYSKIEKNLQDCVNDLEEQLSEILDDWQLKHIFNVDFYNFVLVQSGIDYYNRICGEINKYVNLYCQKQKINGKEYLLRKLKKQILSISESEFELPEKFESDEEVYNSLNQFFERSKKADVQGKAKQLVESIDDFDINKIYVANKNYTVLSKFITKDCGNVWSEIQDCLVQYYREEGGAKTEEKAKKKANDDKYKSLEEINSIESKYTKRENITNTKYFIKGVEELTANYSDEPLIYDEKTKLLEDENAVNVIKNRLDTVLELFHWINIFNVEDTREKDNNFYGQLNELLDGIDGIVSLYNKVRNYVTQKPYSDEKIKLNFKSPTLANGWSKSKERDNNAVLFIRDEKYYLGVFNAKNKPSKEDLEGNITIGSNSDYKKIEYYLLPNPNQMLPKVFLSKKGIKLYQPSEDILAGYKMEKHKKTSDNFDLNFCHELIDFFKDSIKQNEDWAVYDFEFSDTKSYSDISEFYKEISTQGYKIKFKYISEETIERLVDEDKMYLFQIYNKDFAGGKKGRDNLHTMYLKNLFSEENLNNVVLKLNGEAELFYRKSSIKNPIVHKKGSVLVNKTYVNESGEKCIIPDEEYMELFNFYNNKTDKLSKKAEQYLEKCTHYEATMDIVKDKRYTMDKYFFHLPITINYEKDEHKNINEISVKYIAENNDINVIGIDRGERNLIYVSVINFRGEILKQKSFNVVNNYNYRDKLDEKEHNRQERRKNWKEIGKIKELKEGYLSQVIHEIAKMMLEYNAIIVMEDLNYGFKKGRFKVEKQVYQKFETMLINKLNYLVDKEKVVDEEGGLLRGYQMTYVPESLNKLGKQDGMIFYVPAGYTSKIDPATGFVNVFNFNAITTNASKKEFLIRFDEISYDKTRAMFKFAFDYDNFVTYQNDLAKKKWCVYTNKERVITYRNKDGYIVEEEVKPTEKLMKSFANAGINYNDGHNLISDIEQLDNSGEDLEIIKTIISAFKNTVQMRNSISNDPNYDRIVSPVLNEAGNFYDSFEVKGNEAPKDADANGAYNIALKGLYITRQIREKYKEGEKLEKIKIDNKAWFDFIQNRRFEE